MSVEPASFDLALAGPTLDAPLLFARHAQKIEAWLRTQYPDSSGYRVSVKEATGPKQLQWTVRLDSGWFSGVEILLKANEKSPHKAQLRVDGSSRFERALSLVGGLAGLPAGIILLAIGARLLKSLLLVFVLMIPLMFAWLFTVSLAAALIGSAARRISGNEFDAERRLDLALRLKGLSIGTDVRG